MSHPPIIIPEINNQNEICDHTNQSAFILKQKHPVYIFYKNLPPLTLLNFFKTNNVRVIKFLPFNRFSIIFKINSYLTFNFLYLFILVKYHRRPIYWIFYPSLANLLKISLKPYQLVFDILDGFISTPKENKYLLKNATLVPIMSQTLLNYYQTKYGSANYFLSHPASKLIISHINKHSVDNTSIPRIVYLGAINERLNFSLIYQIVKSLPKVNFLFAGPINHDYNVTSKPVKKLFDQIIKLPNFSYQSVLPKNKIAEFLNNIDMGIIPYDISEKFNRLSFPLKSIEYLLAQKPIISTGIDELLYYPDLFKIANTPKTFVKEINKILASKPDKKFYKLAKTFCLQHTWKHKISLIEKSL